jgi:hypothetical protein
VSSPGWSDRRPDPGVTRPPIQQRNSADDPLSEPEWRLAGVRFVGADRIELSIANGEAVTVDIEPHTLASSGMVDRCTDADYSTWND